MKLTPIQVGGLRPFVDALPVPERLAETPMSSIPALAPRYFEYGTPKCYTLREHAAYHQFQRETC